MRILLILVFLSGTAALQEEDGQALRLRLSCEADLWRGEGTLPVRFLLENAGNETISLPEPEDYLEGLQITGPDGRVVKLTGKTREVVRTFEAAPGTFHGCTVDISPLLNLPEDVGGDGHYRLVWNFFDAVSNELSILVVRNYVARVETNMGSMSFELDPKLAPRHVLNFIELAGKGSYKRSRFHRLIAGFMVQGGRVADAADRPSPLRAEFSREPHVRGTLSMARTSHPDSATTEFFICFGDLPHLDGRYTVFGRMIEGEETLARIEAVPTDHSPCGGCKANLPSGPTEHCGKKGHHQDAPEQDIVIKNVALELRKDEPEEAPKEE